MHIRNLLHTLFHGFEVGQHSGTIIVIDLPVFAVGLEASVVVTNGTMFVSNASDWIGPLDEERTF